MCYRLELSSQQPRKPSGQGQSEPQTLRFFARFRDVDVKNQLHVAGWHAWSFIFDAVYDPRVGRRDAERDGTSLGRVLNGVGEQIDENLLHPAGIGFAIWKHG